MNKETMHLKRKNKKEKKLNKKGIILITIIPIILIITLSLFYFVSNTNNNLIREREETQKIYDKIGMDILIRNYCYEDSYAEGKFMKNGLSSKIIASGEYNVYSIYKGDKKLYTVSITFEGYDLEIYNKQIKIAYELKPKFLKTVIDRYYVVYD